MVAPVKWSEERDVVLKLHWGTECARAIGKLLGVSKNAVIGRAHRLGLPYCATPAQLKRLDTQGRPTTGYIAGHYVLPEGPPSKAMIRLARHCPVTARALELRSAA
jgi:hypothetical protein